MSEIAILGYGTVGSGVAELFDDNRENIIKKTGKDISVKYILDVRDFPGNRFEEKIVHDFGIIENDKDIEVVVETIGGVGAAYEFTKRALKKGKHVVTSNKELVSEKGDELFRLAESHGVRYLFEAAVGGGIPVIHPIYDCLAANKIESIVGILNGSTYYILTQMINENRSFDDALKTAQELGYAEKDPTADVKGYDTCRKICILASLAFGNHIYPKEVYTEGIDSLTLDVVKRAHENGFAVKLLGVAKKTSDGKLEIFVSPCALPLSHPLATVEDVYNGVCITGNKVGRVSFFGRGAGKDATASAVCSDVIETLVCSEKKTVLWDKAKDGTITEFGSIKLDRFEGLPIIGE